MYGPPWVRSCLAHRSPLSIFFTLVFARSPVCTPPPPLLYTYPSSCMYIPTPLHQPTAHMLNQHLSTPPPNYCCCVMPVHDHFSSHQNEPGCTRVQQGFAGPFTFNHSFRKRIQPPAEGAINTTTRLSKNAKKKTQLYCCSPSRLLASLLGTRKTRTEILQCWLRTQS